MDLRNNRIYSNMDLVHDDRYISDVALSARDTYGLQKPVVLYDPIGKELEHLDKTIFLERRMRVQENIINRHKSEADRAKDKNIKVITKHLSSSDLKTKKSYSDMFNSKQSSRKGGNNYSESPSQEMWIPKDSPFPVQYDYPVVETMDTSRGKAKYALVRINSSGPTSAPEMYFQSVQPLQARPNNIMNYDIKRYSDYDYPQRHSNQNSHLIDPNRFIGPENRAVLEKVNGGHNSTTDELDMLVNQSNKTVESNKKRPTKKKSKITMEDVTKENNDKVPSFLRKPKQSAKTSDNDLSKISKLDLDNIKIVKHDRHNNSQYSSRNGSLTTRRQSTQSWSKHSHTTSQSDTPLSFATMDTGTSSPVSKRSRQKREKQKRSVVDNSRQSTISPQIVSSNKKEERQIETKPDIKVPTKTPRKLAKTNDNKTKQQEEQKNQGRKDVEQNTTSNFENKIKPVKKIQEQTKTNNKVNNSEQGKQAKNNSYADKNRGLRKTDSFKVMGNSSHFFGYVSTEPEEATKKPKSILKKTKNKPDRPDTA